MRGYDLTPLFRSSVGFDRFSNLLETALKTDETAASYPPYNIVKQSDDAYRITMAVAGFKLSDITITAQPNQLTVSGKSQETEGKNAQYLHRGIANRAFERKFSLADHVKVTNAALADGLLHIDLVREIPEAVKPRMIPINGSETIDGSKVN
ncbi:MAG: Hsp20 family protein [Alphaproteobacteria bacterium]|nr:Hsp20 family protein [Alphaproteobacteria bacterium]